METQLQVVVNGQARQTDARTLGELLEELGYRNDRLATAVDGTFVPALARPDLKLVEGQKVEIVSPRQGG